MQRSGTEAIRTQIPSLLFIFLKLMRNTKILIQKRNNFHKGVFLGPEYFNNIFVTNSHIQGTCVAANFESNGRLVWCLLSIKSGLGNSIPVLPEVAIFYLPTKDWLKVLGYNAWANSTY